VHNARVQSYYAIRGLINRFRVKKIAKHKDVTWIAVSEQAKEKMLSLPVSFNLPIHVIPAYIPNTRIDSEPLSETLSRYLHNHQKVITFYGHSFMIHNGNDVYGFRDAFTLFQSLTKRYEAQMGFVLCLSDQNKKKKIADLHLIAKSFGIDELIFWQIGAINNMNALWAHTDVYIRPTSTDGDSVAIREALDMGVQVVASDVCMRPQRSITYEYGNNDDFLRKVLFALEEGHIQPSPDYSNYDKIKAIYTKLL
jgi:glycosyltransferase involved in cell wall biosynthesis